MEMDSTDASPVARWTSLPCSLIILLHQPTAPPPKQELESRYDNTFPQVGAFPPDQPFRPKSVLRSRRHGHRR